MPNPVDKVVKKEVCRCVNCGNEAEMVFTCSLPEVEEKAEPVAGEPAAPQRAKATGTCSHCGNEADMWIDV